MAEQRKSLETESSHNEILATAGDMLARCEMMEAAMYSLGSILDERKTDRPLDDFEIKGLASILRIMGLFLGDEITGYRKDLALLSKGTQHV